jgi:hypothetical protein
MVMFVLLSVSLWHSIITFTVIFLEFGIEDLTLSCSAVVIFGHDVCNKS